MDVQKDYFSDIRFESDKFSKRLWIIIIVLAIPTTYLLHHYLNNLEPVESTSYTEGVPWNLLIIMSLISVSYIWFKYQDHRKYRDTVNELIGEIEVGSFRDEGYSQSSLINLITLEMNRRAGIYEIKAHMHNKQRDLRYEVNMLGHFRELAFTKGLQSLQWHTGELRTLLLLRKMTLL